MQPSNFRPNTTSEQLAVLTAALEGKPIYFARRTGLGTLTWELFKGVKPAFDMYHYALIAPAQPARFAVTAASVLDTADKTVTIYNHDAPPATIAIRVVNQPNGQREYFMLDSTNKLIPFTPTIAGAAKPAPPITLGKPAAVTKPAPKPAPGEAAHKQLVLDAASQAAYASWEKQKQAFAGKDPKTVKQITAQGFNLGQPQTFRVKNKSLKYRVFIRVANGVLVSDDFVPGAELADTSVPIKSVSTPRVALRMSDNGPSYNFTFHKA